MKILVIGESLLEVTSLTNGFLVEGQMARLEETQEVGGGHAGNMAYLFGKWGIETYIASMLGADDFASKIKKEYESIGVRTDYIETSFDKKTPYKLVIVNNANKVNTQICVGQNLSLKKYSFMIEPNAIVSDGTDLQSTLAAFDKYPNAKRFLKIDKPTNEALELCRYANYIIINNDCAQMITNIKTDFSNSTTLVDMINKLKQKFEKQEIIITLGEKGSIYALNGQVKIMPPVNVDVVDTNGAGDVFAGAFIYSELRSFGLEKSICYATISASLSTSKLTSRGGIPSLTEVSNYYDAKFGAHNNPNTPTDNVVNNQNDNVQNA